MMTLEAIIAKIYPEKSPDELEYIFEDVFNHAVAYEPKSWQTVKKEDILKEKIQHKMIRTLFESQEGGEQGIIDMILDSLEEWSENYMLFTDFDHELQQFCASFYALASCINFEWLGRNRQLYILSSSFLAIILSLGLDMRGYIRRNFARFCFASVYKVDAELFTKAIEDNISYIGIEPNGATIAECVADYAKFLRSSNSANLSVADYLDNNSLSGKLDKVNLTILFKILAIYQDLKTGAIWRDINDFLCVHKKLEPGESKNKEKEEDYYLEALTNASEIISWLESYMEVVTWLKGKSTDFIKRLFKVLVKKIDLTDEKQVDLLLQLIEYLPSEYKEIFSGILYFSQADYKFHWDESLLSDHRS